MKFSAASWVYIFVVINLIIAACFGCLFLLFPDSGLGVWSEFTVLAAIFAGLALVAFWQLSTAFVLVRDHELRFRYGLKEKKTDLRNLNAIYVKGAFIILDEGSIPRLTIPRIFSQEKLMIERIQEGTKRSHSEA